VIRSTKTFLPDIEKYKRYVDEIYRNNWITNNGPLVQELETRLAQYLGVKNIVLVANGTVALEIAYRTLGLKGFAVTSPFSFVATTSSLVTNGLLPIFADIDINSFNMDPAKIRRVITPNTSAIVAPHVFGNVCEIKAIQEIADEHGLKVIYDAAHSFGVTYGGESILNHGDISTLSFHATKLFHTIEGGALIIHDDALVEKARYLINFGIENPESIPELGTNAKMNEFEAAMGLCMLDEIDALRSRRQGVYERYEAALGDAATLQKRNPLATNNHAYFTTVFDDDAQRERVEKALNAKQIFPRRYFYPSLDTLHYIEPKQYCPKARSLAQRILALPLHSELDAGDQDRIIETILESL
jgi:dTDP-4-amino-4,6-dideoxygalactose transaminase